MKTIILRFGLAVFALSVCSALRAEESREYAQVNFCVPGSGKHPMSKDEFVKVTIDGPVLVYDSSPIAGSEIVPFVNELLASKHVGYVGVYIREGTTFGDVMRAVDQLRKTNAKNIGISVAQIAAGRKA